MRGHRTQCRCFKRLGLCIVLVGILPIIIIYLLVNDQLYYRVKRPDVSIIHINKTNPFPQPTPTRHRYSSTLCVRESHVFAIGTNGYRESRQLIVITFHTLLAHSVYDFETANFSRKCVTRYHAYYYVIVAASCTHTSAQRRKRDNSNAVHRIHVHTRHSTCCSLVASASIESILLRHVFKWQTVSPIHSSSAKKQYLPIAVVAHCRLWESESIGNQADSSFNIHIVWETITCRHALCIHETRASIINRREEFKLEK